MELYIVVYKEVNAYHIEKYTHRTYSNINEALSHAVLIASNHNDELNKVLKVDTSKDEVSELELAINNGQISLKEK